MFAFGLERSASATYRSLPRNLTWYLYVYVAWCANCHSVYSCGMGSKGQLGQGDLNGRDLLTPVVSMCGRGVYKVITVRRTAVRSDVHTVFT